MLGKTNDGIHFSREFLLNYVDCDKNWNLHLHTMIGMFGDAWVYNDEARGYDFFHFAEKNQGTVMTKIALRVHEIPRMDTTIILTSWYIGERDMRVYKGAKMTDTYGKTLVSAIMESSFIDTVKRSAISPSEVDLVPSPPSPNALDCPDVKRVIVEEELPIVGARQMKFTDLDCNNHVSNNVYPKVVMDSLPARLHERQYKDVHFNFIRETVLGETLELRGLARGDSYIMQGLDENGKLHFCSEMIF